MTKPIPMDALKPGDRFEWYCSPTYSIPNTPVNRVISGAGDVLLVESEWPRGDRRFRFMKVTYNSTGYCTRVVRRDTR